MEVQKVAEYIDKALLKELLERHGCDKDLLEIVACIPAEADFMQVVRCKDCIYYHKENRTCQSKKCATGGSGKVSWVDRMFCSPYKKDGGDNDAVD